MTTNGSGKLNVGGVNGIKSIVEIPASERTPRQVAYLSACLTALAHQPRRWESYQEWGPGGPVQYLASKGIEFSPMENPKAEQRSWYDGCTCGKLHWCENRIP